MKQPIETSYEHLLEMKKYYSHLRAEGKTDKEASKLTKEKFKDN
jgi:glycerol-3-phosphate O-acyltransferase